MAYEINININGDIEDTTTAGMSRTGSINAGKEQEKAQKALGKYVSSQTIQPFIGKVKTMVSQDIGLVTGNSDLQQRVNFGMQAVQYGVNTYKNMQAGAIVATSLGVASPIGMAVGLGLSVLSSAMDILFNDFQIQIKKRLEGYQIKQVNDRQGIAYNKSRK